MDDQFDEWQQAQVQVAPIQYKQRQSAQQRVQNFEDKGIDNNDSLRNQQQFEWNVPEGQGNPVSNLNLNPKIQQNSQFTIAAQLKFENISTDYELLVKPSSDINPTFLSFSKIDNLQSKQNIQFLSDANNYLVNSSNIKVEDIKDLVLQVENQKEKGELQWDWGYTQKTDKQTIDFRVNQVSQDTGRGQEQWQWGQQPNFGNGYKQRQEKQKQLKDKEKEINEKSYFEDKAEKKKGLQNEDQFLDYTNYNLIPSKQNQLTSIVYTEEDFNDQIPSEQAYSVQKGTPLNNKQQEQRRFQYDQPKKDIPNNDEDEFGEYQQQIKPTSTDPPISQDRYTQQQYQTVMNFINRLPDYSFIRVPNFFKF